MKPRQLLKYLESRRGFLDLVYNASPANHYFRKSNGWHHSYLRQAYASITTILPYCKQKEKFISKLQLGSSKFNEAQFLQDICEITIASHFAKILPYIFEYEKKVSPPTDVDFSFCIPITKNDGINNMPHFRLNCNFHFEVKCRKISDDHDDKDIVPIHPASRFQSKTQKDLIINELSNALAGYKETRESPRHDNKLKDFLLSAQTKFKQSDNYDVNILIVCCDDELDMQDWRNYVIGPSGFFTDNPIIPKDDFDKIDAILLTNVLHRHRGIGSQEKTPLNPWDFDKSLNLAYIDPRKACKWQITGLSSLFVDATPEYENFIQYGNIPAGESVQSKSILSVAWFSDANSDKMYFRKFSNKKRGQTPFSPDSEKGVRHLFLHPGSPPGSDPDNP